MIVASVASDAASSPAARWGYGAASWPIMARAAANVKACAEACPDTALFIIQRGMHVVFGCLACKGDRNDYWKWVCLACSGDAGS
jgi:hypothetical protein